MARVYVSSTIADLAEERRAVLDWLRLARHLAVDSYLPASGTVRDSCLEDVAGCDLYVLIVGHRYGFQPPQDNPGGLSITQLEFRRAGQCGIPRVALLRTSIPDVRLSDMGNPARAPLVLGFREEVAGAVRVAEFGDLQGLIQGLSTGVQAELDKLDEQGDRRAGLAAGRVLRLAPRPVFLAGREKLLAGLDDRPTGNEGAGPWVVALCGLGGAGKTSVALEYAHRHLARMGVCWQLPAEDPAVLAAGFGELAAQLGVAGGGDPVAAVHGVLADGAAPWLLMFDNAPDRASVAAFVPPAGPGRVLITSRNSIWSADQAVEVPVLDRQVAAAFLLTRTGACGAAERAAALELAGELGGLPLALEQAGAYMQASGRGIAGYLGLFRARRTELVGKGEPTGYDKQIATTWALAFTELGEGPAGLLRLAACCAAEDIPLDLLLRPEPAAGDFDVAVAPLLVPLLGDDLARDEAVAGLRRFSLISAPRAGLVSVHRLVQAITLDQLPAEEANAWRRAAATVIEAALPGDPQDPSSWPVFAVLLPHAQAALDPASSGMAKVARYLGASGRYAAALAVQRKVLHARQEDRGAEHPDTLTVRADMAHWTGNAGDPAGARDHYAALVPVRERVLGAEHPDTLIARGGLARWTGNAGDEAGARDQLAVLMPTLERILGAEDPDTLTARFNLARWTGEAGDAADARDQLTALVPAMERILGAEHRDTLTARSSLASWTREAGDPAGARKQFAALLPAFERILGAEHPDTLAVRANQAPRSWTQNPK